jgi:hypothetical protein
MEELIKLLEKEGPLTGKELSEKTGIDVLPLWRACYKSADIYTKVFGHKYLRLDQKIEGYARLSPSIMREFLTYTVVGLHKDIDEIECKAEVLYNRIKLISKQKYELAYDTISKLFESLEDSENLKKNTCVLIAGDVVYDMAHSELRPEVSSGKLVNGSDLDIVVISSGLSEADLRSLDLLIYKEKGFLIKNPEYKEEIDYVIKDISKAYEQMEFKDFKSMVACKILHEGAFLYGNHDIFNLIKSTLVEKNVPEKLLKLENEAIENSKAAFKYLLNLSEKEVNKSEPLETEFTKYFYTKEESEEIY